MESSKTVVTSPSMGGQNASGESAKDNNSEMQSRMESLVSELSNMLIPLRYDSRLCSSYIYGQLGPEWSVHRVVHECATMHWLYTYTMYPFKLSEAHAYLATILPPGKPASDFVKQCIQPRIKEKIIRDHGGIPSRWPWLEKSDADTPSPSSSSLASDEW
jgi:hypothetical protein